jgi:hypothetical protein
METNWFLGGGKIIRDGMGQARAIESKYSLDLVFTKTILMDPLTGIIKTGIGLKNGLIVWYISETDLFEIKKIRINSVALFEEHQIREKGRASEERFMPNFDSKLSQCNIITAKRKRRYYDQHGNQLNDKTIVNSILMISIFYARIEKIWSSSEVFENY